MQTPVEIDFREMAGSPEIRAVIAKHVAELEKRYGRVTITVLVVPPAAAPHLSARKDQRLILFNSFSLASLIAVDRPPSKTPRCSPGLFLRLRDL